MEEVTDPQTNENGPGPESQETDQPSRRTGCFVTVVPLAIILGAVAYFAQTAMTPNVDPNETKPVVVERASDNEAENDPTKCILPEGAITALITQQMIDQAEHPFDPLMMIAKKSRESIDENITDYTAKLISQVRVDGELLDEKYLDLKIRHARHDDGKYVPFSVYTKFLKPKANVGQEVIWVKGQNNGNLIAHATGLLNVKRFYLSPDSALAMEGNRYPIRDIGFRNLLTKMVQIGRRDRVYGECRVTLERDVQINGVCCSMLQAVHPERRDYFEFHIAKIYIDDARNIPVAYEGFLWPEKEGEEPPLLERYYYTDIKTNVGLTDEDFDPDNLEYEYPKW